MNNNFVDNQLDFEDISFTITNKDGLEVVCDVLSSYYDEESDKLYFAFTDYTLSDDNMFNSYIVEAVKSQNGYDLIEIDNSEIREKLINDTLERNI